RNEERDQEDREDETKRSHGGLRTRSGYRRNEAAPVTHGSSRDGSKRIESSPGAGGESRSEVGAGQRWAKPAGSRSRPGEELRAPRSTSSRRPSEASHRDFPAPFTSARASAISGRPPSPFFVNSISSVA